MSEEKTNEMLYDKIQAEIKAAMVAKDNVKRDCLRTIISEIKNLTVNEGKPITDKVCMQVLQKSVKTHNDSIEQFKNANRLDLVQHETEELQHIVKWLPKTLTEDETRNVLIDLMKTENIVQGKQNFGMVMKLLKDRSDIDKKLASKILGQLLS